MLSLTLFALLIAPQQISTDRRIPLIDAATKQEGARLIEFSDKLVPPKIAPKDDDWTFDWRTAVYGMQGPQENLKFIVFSQERSEQNDRAVMVGQMLARLWEYNYKTLKLDHSTLFGEGRVDVYLCLKGQAGGEQLFDIDRQNSPAGEKVNTIYIYDLQSFDNPVEMAREVAHEYGHATLPGIGGYTQPEDWANGYLGERLFLRHVSTLMSKGLLTPQDAMGASSVQLAAWVTDHVDPMVARAAASGPVKAQLADRSKAGMDAYIGLALYADTILPENVFSRSMQLNGTTDARDYPDSIVLAAEEPDSYTLRIPKYLAAKTIWIPLGGKVKLTGATIARRNGDWALIHPGSGPVQVINYH
jgi:hypothetical protein